MPGVIRFRVRGLPATEGSKVGRIVHTRERGDVAVVVDVNQRSLADWRRSIGTACSFVYQGTPLEGPVGVKLSFYFLRPKTQTRRQREQSWLPNGKDLDKLERAVFDAVKMIAWRDDRQVAFVTATKRYADDEHLPGLEAEIWSLE